MQYNLTYIHKIIERLIEICYVSDRHDCYILNSIGDLSNQSK